MTSASQPRGLVDRVASSYISMRAETRALIERAPSEGALLALVMLSGLFGFLGAMAMIWIRQPLEFLTMDYLLNKTAAAFSFAFIFRSLLLYGAAALLFLICRGLHGQGGAKDTRIALFWAALVAAPIGLVIDLIAALPMSVGFTGKIIGRLGDVIFLVFLSSGLAEAHKYKRASVVLLTFAAFIGVSFVVVKFLATLQI